MNIHGDGQVVLQYNNKQADIMPKHEFVGKPKPNNATNSQMHHLSAHNMILNGGSSVKRNAPRQVKSMAGPAHYVASGSISSGKK